MYKKWIENVRKAEKAIISLVMQIEHINRDRKKSYRICTMIQYFDPVSKREIACHYNDKGFLSCIDAHEKTYIIGEKFDRNSDMYIPYISKVIR
jgi:hypothetical protein